MVRRQHGVISRGQLLALGFTAGAIRHRIEAGRLHPVRRSVYAVGRPGLGRAGGWMAAVLACGPGAELSHESAAALLSLADREDGTIHVSVPRPNRHRPPGITVHRRLAGRLAGATVRNGIPVTDPVRTLIDLAACRRRPEVEALVNEADKLDLVDPESLRKAIAAFKGERGVGVLARVLDARTFTLTDSELERRFLPLARRAGLTAPRTRAVVNGFRVDFWWPDLGLVVETDGLRYHRTPAQQARDRLRDQTHTAAGLICLRFTHAQVRYEPARVERTLADVARRLRRETG